MSRAFKLDGREPVPCTLLEWAQWYETADEERIVAVAGGFQGGASVWTYFVGLERFGDESSPPLLFESQVRNGRGHDNGVLRRYATWAEAEAGHQELVARVERGHAEATAP